MVFLPLYYGIETTLIWCSTILTSYFSKGKKYRKRLRSFLFLKGQYVYKETMILWIEMDCIIKIILIYEGTIYIEKDYGLWWVKPQVHGSTEVVKRVSFRQRVMNSINF